MNSEESDVIYLRLKDKFGDSGIIGTSILKYKDEKTVFDTFLLSCRVLGRGVEDAFLIQVLKLAKMRGCKVAIGEYYATRKNAQVEHFYSKQGFDEMNETQSEADRYFQYGLDSDLRPEPDFFKNIISEISNR